MSRLNILKLPRTLASAPREPEPAPVPAVVPATLCRGCVFSQIVRGYVAEHELVLCGYDGQLRSLPFPVSDCTDYRDRDKRTRVGFGAGV